MSELWTGDPEADKATRMAANLTDEALSNKRTPEKPTLETANYARSVAGMPLIRVEPVTPPSTQG